MAGNKNSGSGGRRPGSGRKSKAEEMGLSETLDRVWKLSDREAVLERLHNIATGDDSKAAISAASLLLSYAYGKPTERHEHTGKDGEPLMQPVAEAMLKVYGNSNLPAK